MNRPVAMAVGVATAVALTLAHAEVPKRKPGLWEVEATMAMKGMPGKTPPMHVRFCLSPQDAADEEGMAKGFAKQNAGLTECGPSQVTRTSSELRWHSVCHDKDGTVTENDSRVHDITPVSYAAEWTGKSSDGMEIHMQQTARWLGSDCGSVR